MALYCPDHLASVFLYGCILLLPHLIPQEHIHEQLTSMLTGTTETRGLSLDGERASENSSHNQL